MCQRINAVVAKEDEFLDIYDWEDIFCKVITPLFDGSSKACLQIILDGVDELEKHSMDNFIRFLHLIQSNPELKISTLCTTRPSILPLLGEFYSNSIAIVKEKQLPDLKALIWHHLNTDSGLRKLSRYMKQTISSKLEEKANGKCQFPCGGPANRI
jgi:hypothetical protein